MSEGTFSHIEAYFILSFFSIRHPCSAEVFDCVINVNQSVKTSLKEYRTSCLELWDKLNRPMNKELISLIF